MFTRKYLVGNYNKYLNYREKIESRFDRNKMIQFEKEKLTQEQRNEGILVKHYIANTELYVLINNFQKDLEERLNPIKYDVCGIRLLKVWGLHNLKREHVKEAILTF